MGKYRRQLLKIPFAKQIENVIKRLHAKVFYNLFMWAQKLKKKKAPMFLNLGIVSPTELKLQLKAAHEKERLQFQLYHYLCHKIEFEGKEVFEIGCGTGGGCLFVKEYLKAQNCLGIDIVLSQINFAKTEYSIEGVSFKVGDACHIKEPTASKDIVLNVESSHAYSDFDSFIDGVYRCLRKGGTFIYADVWYAYELAEIEERLLRPGFRQIHKEDISTKVVQSLDIDHERKVNELIKTKIGKSILSNFSFLKGSVNYEMLKSGETVFIHYILEK